ncbi:GNAT family N-acetyltransferase [Halobacterium sp. KA-6]|uniref:GNAT family N-acetyltransferase n=1 Tax=Halobacterium sp. KA-6 TaxID=2896368 RepID=UPI001E517386|nr:GNAT family protein [Halobacterium sp. KA-6]MCD2201806.1 GNAT family N-acetyltransferase [Halobacterium sp. KA-6]
MPGPIFLRGDTVTLRPPEREDLDAIREWLNHPQVWRPALDPLPANEDTAESYFERSLTSETDVKCLVCVDKEPVGVVSLTTTEYGPTATDRARSVELAYHLSPEYHGRGYGSEAAGRLVQYAFEDLNMRRVTAHVGAFNDASIGLLESLGFTHEGTRREAAFYRGYYHDMLTYGLLREEWEDT